MQLCVDVGKYVCEHSWSLLSVMLIYCSVVWCAYKLRRLCPAEFARAVRWVGSNLDFNRNISVSVFETNIRVLGGLISGHLLASDPKTGIAALDVSCLRELGHENSWTYVMLTSGRVPNIFYVAGLDLERLVRLNIHNATTNICNLRRGNTNIRRPGAGKMVGSI